MTETKMLKNKIKHYRPKKRMVKANVEKPAAERSDSNSKYKGIRKRKWGKWVSEIRLPNSRQRIWLGSYDSAEKAARAFDAAMFCLRGVSAQFNFPGDPPEIAGGRSMTPSQIQAAAARYANSEPQVGYSGRPVSTQKDFCSLLSPEETAAAVQMESPSPCLSEVTVQAEGEVAIDGSVSNLFVGIGSGGYKPEYSVFPGFDDFGDEFYLSGMPSYDYGEENNLEGLIIEDSFLWNF